MQHKIVALITGPKPFRLVSCEDGRIGALLSDGRLVENPFVSLDGSEDAEPQDYGIDRGTAKRMVDWNNDADSIR